MNITIKAADNSTIFSGNIDDIPQYGDYIDVYEEAVNMGLDSGTTKNGWKWSREENNHTNPGGQHELRNQTK